MINNEIQTTLEKIKHVHKIQKAKRDIHASPPRNCGKADEQEC